MGRKKKTNEEFLRQLKDKGRLEKVSPLEEYKGKKIKIRFSCKTCGHEWETRPDHILSGCGCPECKKQYYHDKYAKTNEQFLSELKEKDILEKIDILDEYYANDIPIQIRCKKCGNIWREKPLKILNGKLCPKCAKENRKKDNIKFILELKENGILEYIIPLEDYKGCKENILFKCLRCGNEFKATPDNILQKQPNRCPKCSQSSLEYDIEELLTENNIEFIKQYIPKFLINGKSHLTLDFYLPKYNIAIECQGKQHFYSVKHFGGKNGLTKRIECDERKYKLCEENSLPILYYVNYNVPKGFEHHQYFKLGDILNEIRKYE